MDIFSACLAFGPLGIYLLLLGVINFSRRPIIISGTRETLAVGLALSGLVMIGPMQLFMPQEAAARFGEWIWLLLVSFYILSLLLLIMLSRPRLVVYNMTAEQLQPVLAETAERLDHDARWAGNTLSMPQMRVHLQIDAFAPLATVSLRSASDDQSAGGWSRLEMSLRQALHQAPAPAKRHGFGLAWCGFLILLLLAIWVADDPEAVARGLARMLQP